MPFSKLGLSSSLIRAIETENYQKPYPIQLEAIPAILKGRDVLGIAKTGSGKTASYVLPILNKLQGKTEEKNRDVDALIIVPTRELAVQVEAVFRNFGQAFFPPVKSMAVYGGVSINPQMKSLYGINILVATPGRLLELIEHKAVNIKRIKTLVLDEADKLLNLGFKEEIGKILSLLPESRQNLLFSATLSDDVRNINQIIFKDPLVLNVDEAKDDEKSDPAETLEQIKQTGYWVTEENKGPLLRYLIKSQNITQALVFTSSVYKADNVADKLRKNGINALAIHSKKSQGARTEALKKFKAGEVNILVATDLLSRGIDIEFLPYVINYELPRSPKDYVHRIGRTGRAEASGEAIAFITEEDKHHFKVIQKKMKRWVDMVDSANLEF